MSSMPEKVEKEDTEKLRQLRSFLYKGTRITINKHHRYEWKITILRPSILRIVQQKIIYDCTSRLSKQFTLEDAKHTVNAILTPFHYQPWH